MFEGWRERLERLLADLTPQSDPREQSVRLKQGIVELKVGLQAIRDGLEKTQQELDRERTQLEAARRRGRLAAEIPDDETVRVAEEFAARHQERIVVLEHKLAVHREEQALAGRDLDELRRRLRSASRGVAADGSSPEAERAWRDIESAGGVRPETDIEGELLQSDLDRQAREAAVAAQLEHLKRKLRRDG